MVKVNHVVEIHFFSKSHSKIIIIYLIEKSSVCNTGSLVLKNILRLIFRRIAVLPIVKGYECGQGVIDIRLLDEVDSIRVEIEDNGKGIAAKDLANIFERFYRTDASRNSTKGGSGIGLSIVKKIIEDHGGYIWATSKEGEGTCLHFVIRKYREAEGHEQDIDH